MSEVVFGLPRPQQRAGRGQFGLHALVALEQRRQAVQLAEQGEADGADHRAGVVMDRQAHDHQRFLGHVLQVQQDRSPGPHHFAQQAAGNHAFAGLADGLFGAGEAETPGVALVHPDDPRVAVDDHGAFAGLFDDLEQRANRQQADPLVVLEAFAVVHGRFAQGLHAGAPTGRVAASSSRVYGCCGSSKTLQVLPRSTTWPSLITIRSWARARTTDRSWLMNR